MARLQDTQIVFQIKGDNKDVLAKIQEAAKEKAKFEASGESTVKMIVDKNGIADVQEIFSQIKADGENTFKMLFDGDVTKKLLGGTVEEIEAKFEKISKIAADFLNNMQFVGASAPGANADYFAKQEQAAKKLEDRLKSLKKQQAEYFKKTISDPLTKEMSGKGTDHDLAKLKTLYDFAKQSGMDKELKDHKWNAVDYRGKKQEYSFKDIGNYLKGTSVDRDMMQKYKEVYIKESLSDVNNAISKILQHKNYLSTSDLDSIIQTDNYNLKDILSRAQKYKKANPSGYASVVSDDGGASQGGSGENPITDPNKSNISKTQDVDINFIVKDEQLSTLREKIKTAASDIPVTISSVQTKDGLTLDVDANVKSINKKDEKVVQTEQPTLANATFEDLKKTLSDVQIKVDDQDALSKIDNIKTKLENAVDVQIKVTDAIVGDDVTSKIQDTLNQNEFKVSVKNDTNGENDSVDANKEFKDGDKITLYADLKLVDGQPETLKQTIEAGLQDISINIKDVTFADNIKNVISKKLSEAGAAKIPDNAPGHIKSKDAYFGIKDIDRELVDLVKPYTKEYQSKYNTDNINVLYKQIEDLLMSSVERKSELDDNESANLVALVRRYKRLTTTPDREGKSPVAEILKRNGVDNFDDVLGNYSSVKEVYEKWLKQHNEIVNFKKQNAGGFDLNVKISDDSVNQIKSTINSILNPAAGHEINLSTVSGLENLTQALANAIGSGAAQGNNKAEAEAQKTLAAYKELDVMMDKLAAKKDVYQNSKKYYEYLAQWDDKKMKYILPEGLGGKMLRNGFSTDGGIKKAIKEYKNAKDSGDQEKIKESEKKLIALTSAYGDVEKAADVFGEKNITLWTEIKNKIDLAKKSTEIWQKIHMQASSINQKAGSIIGQKNIGMTSIDIARMLIGSGGKEALWKALDQNGLDSSILFGKEKSAEKVDATVKLALDPDSKGGVQSEVNVMFTNVPLTVKFENIETIQGQLDTLFKNITLEIGNIKWSGNTLFGATTQTPIVEQPAISTDNIVTSTQSGDVQVPATVETVKIEELPQKTKEVKQQVETPMVVNIETNEAEERVNRLRESITKIGEKFLKLHNSLSSYAEYFNLNPEYFSDGSGGKYSKVITDDFLKDGKINPTVISDVAGQIKELWKKTKKNELSNEEWSTFGSLAKQLAHLVYGYEVSDEHGEGSASKLVGNKEISKFLTQGVRYFDKKDDIRKQKSSLFEDELIDVVSKYNSEIDIDRHTALGLNLEYDLKQITNSKMLDFASERATNRILAEEKILNEFNLAKIRDGFSDQNIDQLSFTLRDLSMEFENLVNLRSKLVNEKNYGMGDYHFYDEEKYKNDIDEKTGKFKPDNANEYLNRILSARKHYKEDPSAEVYSEIYNLTKILSKIIIDYEEEKGKGSALNLFKDKNNAKLFYDSLQDGIKIQSEERKYNDRQKQILSQDIPNALLKYANIANDEAQQYYLNEWADEKEKKIKHPSLYEDEFDSYNLEKYANDQIRSKYGRKNNRVDLSLQTLEEYEKEVEIDKKIVYKLKEIIALEDEMYELERRDEHSIIPNSESYISKEDLKSNGVVKLSSLKEQAKYLKKEGKRYGEYYSGDLKKFASYILKYSEDTGNDMWDVVEGKLGIKYKNPLHENLAEYLESTRAYNSITKRRNSYAEEILKLTDGYNGNLMHYGESYDRFDSDKILNNLLNNIKTQYDKNYENENTVLNILSGLKQSKGININKLSLKENMMSSNIDEWLSGNDDYIANLEHYYNRPLSQKIEIDTTSIDQAQQKIESVKTNVEANPITVPTEVTGDGLTTLQGVSENVNTTPTTPIVTTTTTSGDNNDGGNSGTPINNGSAIPIPIKLVPSVEELKADINKLNNEQITLNVVTNPSLDSIKTKIQEVANQGVGAGVPLDFSKIVPQNPIDVKLNVTPSVESVQTSINSINKASLVDVKLNIVPSIENIKAEINSLSTEEHPAVIKISSNTEEIKNVKDGFDSIKDKLVELTIKSNISNVKSKFDAIKNKDVTLGIKLGESKLETIDNIKQSLNDLSGIDASSFSNSFKTLTSDITSQAKQQVTSIKEVVSALSELEKKLSSAGFKKVSDATAIAKEFDKLQKQEDNIKKQREKAQASLEKKEAAIKKKEEKLQQREAKEEERRQKAETIYQNKLASVKAKEEKIKQDQALLKENQRSFKEQQKLEKEKMKAKSIMVDEDGEPIDKKGVVQSLYNAAGNTSFKDKNFSIVSKSARVDDYGVLRFKAYLEDAAGNIQKFAYQVDDINSIITNGGSLNANFLKRSGTNLDIVEATKQAALNAIAKQKTFNATNHYGIDQTDLDNQSKQYANEAIAAEQQLLNLLKSAKLEESEKLAIQKEITDAKQQEAKVLTVNTMKAEQQTALMKSQDKFNHLFGGLNTSDDISSQFLNKTISLDGQEVNLQDVVANLKNESQSMLDVLQNGAFESIDAFKSLNNQLNKTLDTMAQISSSENMISANASQLLKTMQLTTEDGENKTLSSVRNSTKQKMIYDELASRYGQTGLRVGDYSDSTGANVRFIDDGVVKSATVYFEEYTAAVDQNTQALSANADASQKVNMASMRMSRVKTQNVTVESVMNEEAINKINAAASKTKDFEIVGKPLIDEDGIVRFIANVRMADGEVRELKYSVEDLNKIITGTGKFKTSFLRTGTVTADINAQVETTKAIINQQKMFDATSHHGMTTKEIEEASQVNKNAVAEAEKELKAMMDASNLTAKEKLEIERQITAEKEKQIQVSKVEDMSSVQQNALKLAKDNYAKYFGNLETDDDIQKRFLDKMIDVDGEEVNLQARVATLRDSAKSMLDIMTNGTFESRDEFKKLSNQITDVYDKMKQLNNLSNLTDDIFKLESTGRMFGKNDLSELTNTEKMQMIRNAYESQKYKVLNVSGYSNTKNTKTGLDLGSTVDYVDHDGKIVRATVSLEKYTSALYKNKVAAGENAEALQKMDNVIVRTTKTKLGGDNLSFGQKWLDGMKHKIGNLTQYLTGMGIIMRGVRQIREGFAFVKELDANMTTIYQTMDITTKGLEELSSRSIEASKNLGAVATEMLKSVNIYAAYGKTVDEIINQATPTVMLANASGAGAEQASDYIQAVVQQYEELEGQETKIVNAYEKIAANVQIDFSKAVQGISEGVQVAGSIMNEAGVEFETYAASLAKIVEKTRTDGSQVGNALKTIASRISRSSSGDEDVSEEDRSKASAAYSSVGISVYNDDGSYRGLSTILDELSTKWDDLTDAQRNYIAEQSAGVRNINVFNTMLDTWGDAKQLAADANEDTDYYMEVQEKWMESMTAKMNTLKATMQEFWYNLIDVGVINFGIDLLTNLLGVIEGIVNAFKTVGSAFGDIGGQAGGLVGVFTVISTAATLWTSMTKKLVTTNKAGQTMIASAGIGGIVDGIKNLGKEAAATWSMFISGAKGAYDGTTGLIPGIKSVWINLGKIGKTLVGVSATVAALWVAAKVFDTLTTSSKEAAEAAKEASDAYKESQNSLKSNRQIINEIGLEYDKLSDGVDQFGNNISLTTEEFDRYHEICNKIADMYPNLVRSYDEQGNAILKLKGKVEELNAEYDKQQLKAARENVGGLGAYIEDTKNITDHRNGWTEFVDSIGDWGRPDVGEKITNKEAVEFIKEIQKMNDDDLKSFVYETVKTRGKDNRRSYLLNDELLGVGFIEELYLSKDKINSKEFEERINAMRDKIPELLAKYTSEINDKSANVKSGLQDLIKIMQLDPDSYPEFKNADSSVFDRATDLVSSMTMDQIDKFMSMGDKTEIENALRKYVYDIVSVLNSDEEAKLSLENILGLNEESSVEDIKKALSVDLEKLSEALKINKAELKVQLGLEDEEEFIKMYNNTLESASEAVSNSSRSALGEVYEEFKDNVTSLDLSTRIIDSNKLINKDSNIEFDGELGASFNTKTFVSDDATKAVVVTPVLPDGTVLNDKDLKEYAEKLLKGEKIDVDIKVAAFDGKDAEKQAKTFADRLKKASKTYISITNASKRVKEFMREQNINTTNEVALLQKCVDTTDSWAEAMRKFKHENVDLKLNDEIIDGLKANLELVEKTIENVDEAAKASYSAKGLTSEQIENIKNAFGELEGFDYDQLFESTAEGVHLNAQELDRLNGEYEEFQKAKYAKTLSDLEEEYAGLCIGINEAVTATEKIDLINKRDGVLEQIQKVQELASQYEGLTNAVSNYKRAKELGEEGDTFLEIQGDLEKIEELWNHGLVGTNQFKAAVQMMTNKDMSDASVEDYVETYKAKIGQFKSWMTEDASGLQKFLYDIKELGFADIDENGFWSIDGSVREMAESLGTSDALVQEIFKRLKDFGFDVDFEEETDHLKNLKTEAIAARDAITNEKYKLNLDVKGEDALSEQIELGKKLLGTLDEGTDAYKHVQKQLDYLQAKAGETADAMNFSLNYTDNKDEIDGIITKLHSLEKYKDIYINFENVNINNVEGQIDNVKSELEKLKDPETGKINFKTEGASELADILISLYNKKIELTNTSAVLKLDAHNLDEQHSTIVTKVQDIKKVMDEISSLEAKAALGVDVTEDKEKLNGKLDTLIASLNEEDHELLVKMGFDDSDKEATQENMQAVIDGLTAEKLVELQIVTPEEAKATLGYVVADAEKNVEIKLIDDEWNAFKNDINEDKFADLYINIIREEYDKIVEELEKNPLKQKVVLTTDNSTNFTPVSTNPSQINDASINGNANVNGNAKSTLRRVGAAFAKGAWGAAKSGMSLVGELGRELVKLLPV